MGTWYVTVVVIVKYIWPDKEMSPGFVSPRWAMFVLFNTPQLCLPTPPLHPWPLLNGSLCSSSSSWTAVFNAMPTICFGFQVPRNMWSSDTIDLSAVLMHSFGKKRKTNPFVFAVPCQLRAGVQQHEQKGDKTLGTCRHAQHDHLPLCLHGNRYNVHSRVDEFRKQHSSLLLWSECCHVAWYPEPNPSPETEIDYLSQRRRSFVYDCWNLKDCFCVCWIRGLRVPDVWLQRQPGHIDDVPFQRHRRGLCQSFHRHLRRHVLPNFTLLWQVR